MKIGCIQIQLKISSIVRWPKLKKLKPYELEMIEDLIGVINMHYFQPYSHLTFRHNIWNTYITWCHVPEASSPIELCIGHSDKPERLAQVDHFHT